MPKTLPPIYRDCRRLLVHTEQVVRRFSRYHKYTLGTELRQQAMQIMRTVHYAVFDKALQAKHLQRMVWLVDDYKLSLQLGMDVGAFTLASPQQGRAGATAGQAAYKGTFKGAFEGGSFAAFEAAAVLAADIGKQCGGWQQSVAKSAQSTHAPPGTPGDFGQKPAPAGQVSPASLSASATLPLGEVTP